MATGPRGYPPDEAPDTPEVNAAKWTWLVRLLPGAARRDAFIDAWDAAETEETPR